MINFNNRNRGWGHLFYKLTHRQLLQCFYLSVVHFQFFTRHCPIGSREVFFLLNLLVKNFSVLLLNFLFAKIFVTVKHNLMHVVLYAFHLLLRPLQLFYDLLAFDSVVETLSELPFDCELLLRTALVVAASVEEVFHNKLLALLDLFLAFVTF